MICLKIAAVLFVFNACTGKGMNTPPSENRVDQTEIKQDHEVRDSDSSAVDVEVDVIKPDDRKIKEQYPGNIPEDKTTEIIVPPRQEPKLDTEEPAKSSVEEILDSMIQKPNEEVSNPEPELIIQVPDHSKFDRLLKIYVSEAGNVDYSGLKNNQKLLDEYLSDLKINFIAENWSRKAKMAYWINAYNAFTIKLILDNYPVKSIMNIHGGKAWDVRWIELGTNKYTLNQIENEILRPVYKDPRIHFAVNCAARSCPPLLNEAWTEENLEKNLEHQTIAFINNQSENIISLKEVEVSKIFDWYSEDFGDLISYLNKYSKNEISQEASVRYKEYSWDLNKQ